MTTPDPHPHVSVRRTGGFIGRTVEGSLDLASDDSRVEEARSLVARIDPATIRAGLPHPDMYSYEFDLDGRRLTVPQQHLTDDLRRLADLLLLADPSR